MPESPKKDLTVNSSHLSTEGASTEVDEIFLTKYAYDIHHYWIPENINGLKGGKIMWNAKVYIRSATIGTYLSSDMTTTETPISMF